MYILLVRVATTTASEYSFMIKKFISKALLTTDSKKSVAPITISIFSLYRRWLWKQLWRQPNKFYDSSSVWKNGVNLYHLKSVCCSFYTSYLLNRLTKLKRLKLSWWCCWRTPSRWIWRHLLCLFWWQYWTSMYSTFPCQKKGEQGVSCR